MRDIGVDIRVVGLITLAQAPWTFKVLWAPLMDRYVPPFWGRRRGWMAVTQVALLVLGLMMAGVGQRPDAIWVVGALSMAIAMAAASQDIAIDAYAVEVPAEGRTGRGRGRARSDVSRRVLRRRQPCDQPGRTTRMAGSERVPRVAVRADAVPHMEIA
jgi:MFS family permease